MFSLPQVTVLVFICPQYQKVSGHRFSDFVRFPTGYKVHLHSEWSPFYAVSCDIFGFWLGSVVLILCEKPSATDLPTQAVCSSCLLEWIDEEKLGVTPSLTVHLQPNLWFCQEGCCL